MFGFDGDFRTRPKVSLGGASKKEKKDSLLLKNQLERQKRENERHRINSTRQIQCWWRASIVRCRLKTATRQEFDNLIQQCLKHKCHLSSKILSEIQRLLLFFYKETIDAERLVSLCLLLIKHQAVSMEMLVCDKHTWHHQTGRILLLCCRLVETAIHSHTPIAAPMRTLEVYTSITTYTKHHTLNQDMAITCVATLMKNLIFKGYFQSIRTLLNERVPGSIEMSPNPPTPVASTVLDLVLRPLHLLEYVQSNTDYKVIVFNGLCRDLLCPGFTDQIGLFLLPALANGKYSFPFVDFLNSLVPDDVVKSNQISDLGFDHLSVWSSPWLLYSVLVLGEPKLGTLADHEVVLYLHILKVLLPSLPSAQLVLGRSRSNVDDSDSEEEDIATDSMQLSSITSLMSVREQCLQMLNSPTLVKCLLSVLNDGVYQSTLTALCCICHCLMTQQRLFVHKSRLLSTLAFNKAFLRHLWESLISLSTTSVTGSQTRLITLLASGSQLCSQDMQRILPQLSLFCSVFLQALITLHDAEFYGDTGNSRSLMPFQLSELVLMSRVLCDACIGMVELAHPETKPIVTDHYRKAMTSVGVFGNTVTTQQLQEQTENWAHVFKVTTQLVKQLHERDIRRQFCPNDHWLSKHIAITADKSNKIHRGHHAGFARMGSMRVSNRLWSLRHSMAMNTNPGAITAMDDDLQPMTTTEARQLTILTELPFVVPFEERVKIFQGLLIKDKEDSQGGELSNFLVGPVIDIIIRRNYIYEDAFDKLRPENEPDVKKKMRVQLVNFQGLNEAGIDGGGLFKEFLSELLKASFDPNRGFFKTTNDRLLYPNPQACILHEDFTKHYYFIGRMLGKALYENMLVELPFASFFLSKLLGRHSSDVDIHHLQSLDPEMYKNLLFLKNYDGDVTDLGLDFTVVDYDLGEAKVHDLKPGGRDIPVTSNNRIEYIHLMADYRLNRQIRPHCMALREGLANVINLDWLRMFDYHELQTLISGATIPVDVEDLKSHTNYSGAYATDHPVIEMFWNVVQRFNDKQKRQLLKFVTSCSRPPLLGFKDLYPAFCIHNGGSDLERLPSASTCMNLLKLPEFTDEDMLRTKLLYAIESGAGFELS